MLLRNERLSPPRKRAMCELTPIAECHRSRTKRTDLRGSHARFHQRG